MEGWCIYSFGGGETLWKVLNAVAMLFSNGNQYFTPALKISASIGAIWAAVRAIWKTEVGIFSKGWFIPTYLMMTLVFVPKTSLWIVDQTDPNFGHRKVDHIPLGLAAVAGSTSILFYELTRMIEEVMGSPDHNLRYTTTGPMFAAKVVAMGRDVRIADPIQRQNVKNFVKQCYMWPYVFSNLPPGATKAMASADILGFIAANPHPGLGIYWRDARGGSAFTICHECAHRVRDLMSLEQRRPFEQLVKSLWSTGPSSASDALTAKMKSYADSGWRHIGVETQNAFGMTGQQMMINAYRESLDDQREIAGARRLSPRLVANSAVRGQDQKNAGFLVSGAMAAEYLPSVQSIVLSILLLGFAFVMPIAMLSGGFQIFTLWAKAVFWVQSWPLFYAVLHAIGMMFYARSAQSVLLGNGAGMTLLTYDGIADVAWNSYCAVQSMFLVIPVLSWGLVSGGGSAIAHIASTLTPDNSAALGTGITDGNQAFDTQAMHTRSLQSFQYGQQQLRPNFAMATSIQDGNFQRTTSTTGDTTYQENMSNLKVTPHLHQGVENNISQALSENENQVRTLSTERSAQESETESKQFQLAQAFSKMQGDNTQFSAEENKSYSDSFAKFQSAAERLSDTDQMINNSGSAIKGGINSSAFAPAKLAHLFGLSVGAEHNRSATDSNILQKLQDAGFGEEDRQALQKGWQERITKGASLQNSETASLQESIHQSQARTKNLSDRLSVAHSQHEALSNTKSYLEKNGASLTYNQTDKLLQDVGDQQFAHLQDKAQRKAAAADLERRNPEQFIKIAAPLLTQSHIRQFGSTSLKGDFRPDYQTQSTSMKQQYASQAQKDSSPEIQERAQSLGLAKEEQVRMAEQRESQKKEILQRIAEPQETLNQAALHELDAKYKTRKDKTTIRRAVVGDKEPEEVLETAKNFINPKHSREKDSQPLNNKIRQD